MTVNSSIDKSLADLAFIELDVSSLEAPEPMKAILWALHEMPAKHWLKVTHRREPFPLYKTLKENGFGQKCEEKGYDEKERDNKEYGGQNPKFLISIWRLRELEGVIPNHK